MFVRMIPTVVWPFQQFHYWALDVTCYFHTMKTLIILRDLEAHELLRIVIKNVVSGV